MDFLGFVASRIIFIYSLLLAFSPSILATRYEIIEEPSWRAFPNTVFHVSIVLF